MLWGVFEDHANELIHTAPCEANGKLSAEHVLSEHCKCKPMRELTRGWDMLHHRDREHGGFNA